MDRPTAAEMKLLEVLNNPENINKSITQLCDLANVIVRTEKLEDKCTKLISFYNNNLNSLTDSYKLLFDDINGIHGLTHTKRVYILACIIADIEKMSEDDTTILMYAALYHDIGRTANGVCTEHGKQSFIKADNLIDNEYRETIKFIIENHCIDDIEGIETIDNYDIADKKKAIYLYKAFKDADNLDRVRINDLNVSFLRLKRSKELVNTAYFLYNEVKIC